MTDERWRRVEALFHRAVDAPKSEREILIAQLCGDDPEVLAEVLTLLRADSDVERLMSSAPAAADGDFLFREPAPTDVVMEYVEGRRLDEVCDDPALSIPEKIELFLQLCGAVAYVRPDIPPPQPSLRRWADRRSNAIFRSR